MSLFSIVILFFVSCDEDLIRGCTDIYANKDRITGNSFNFHHRGFNTAGGDRFTRFPPHGANVQSTYDYYLNKYALLYMDGKGGIVVKEGVSAEVPQLPLGS